MKFLPDQLEAQERGEQATYNVSTLQRAYECRCNRAVFFQNSQCLSCGTALGYEPYLGQVFPLSPGPEAGTWQLDSGNPSQDGRRWYRRCENLNTPAACNWLVACDTQSTLSAANTYCVSCRLNRTIPNLSIAGNGYLWGKLEKAKRRVISALISLGLPVASRVTEDPECGLAFDFLQSLPSGPRVLTGHFKGLITLNIDEADDVKREQMRASMREPYRTLVGHFRHEAGHYYWDRLVANSHWLAEFRSLFGDERKNYAEALKRNYNQGPPPDWNDWYVSAYASVHPWEDWAETWAHYMHMVDTLGTAMSFGLKPESVAMPFDPVGVEALYGPDRPGSRRFLSFLNSWLKLTAVMNELCRSMGQPDFYPFALPRAAATKLHFVHLVVSEVCVSSKLAADSLQVA